ncbi:hypothetical protein V5O48_017435 [Marasmius crinis-equi]|uniref:Uncharacterized protein n=1 Tax=Marasmius crinis-equi TaxID=585013 RepID=A0ABR3EP18_9AGAR
MPPPRSPSKKAYVRPRHESNAYRWKPQPYAPPLHVSCTGDNGTCPNPVSVRICHGTANKKHKGIWYEACDPPDHPSNGHFIDWREDIPRASLPATFKTHRQRPNAALLDMLNGTDTYEEEFVPYPSTPSKHHREPQHEQNSLPCGETRVDQLFFLDHPATPTIRRQINVPDQPVSDEDALHFLLQLDAIEEQEEFLFGKNSSVAPPSPSTTPSPLNYGASGDSPFTLNTSDSCSQRVQSPTTVPGTTSSSLSQTPALSLSSLSWKVGIRRERMHNGKMRLDCAGKLCEAKSEREPPSRGAQNCQFLFCKPCCEASCAEMTEFCKLHASKETSSMLAHSTSSL